MVRWYCGQRFGLPSFLAALLRRLISANAPEGELVAHAFADNAQLAQSAREAVLRGDTTIEEALRVIRPEGGRHADL